MENGAHAIESSAASTEQQDQLPSRTRTESQSLHSGTVGSQARLDDLQAIHQQEITKIRAERDAAHAAKERADVQYQTLLGRVNTIKSQLGERLKADAVSLSFPVRKNKHADSVFDDQEELSQSRLQIEQLESSNNHLRKTDIDNQELILRLQANLEAHRNEVESLRSRTNLSSSNWSKERDDLVSQLAYAREEFDNAKQAMQDWEVLAMEERSLRENLAERVAEAEEQLASHKDGFERVTNERNVLNSTVEGLQRALQEIQEGTDLRLA